MTTPEDNVVPLTEAGRASTAKAPNRKPRVKRKATTFEIIYKSLVGEFGSAPSSRMLSHFIAQKAQLIEQLIESGCTADNPKILSMEAAITTSLKTLSSLPRNSGGQQVVIMMGKDDWNI